MKSLKYWKPYKNSALILPAGTLVYNLVLLIFTIISLKQETATAMNVTLVAIMFCLYILVVIMVLRQDYKLALRLQTKPLPVLFVTDCELPQAKADYEKLKKATGFHNWDKIEGFSKNADYLLHFNRERLPYNKQSWKKYVTDGMQNIRKGDFGVEGRKVFHIGVNGPAALALALGATFGTMHPVVFYHYQKDEYKAVLDLSGDPRKVKETQSSESTPRYFTTNLPEEFKADTAVIIDAAAHGSDACIKVRQHIKDNNCDWSVMEINNQYGNNLREDDWLPAIHELYAIFHRQPWGEAVRRLHVFQSMPMPLAFGLGMALGTEVNVTVYHWDKKKQVYIPVITLNELN